MNVLNPYLKTVVGAAVTLGYAIQAAISDGVLTSDETGGLIALVLTTLGVFTVRNKPTEPTVMRRRADGVSGGV